MIALLLAAQLGGMSIETVPWCPNSPTGWCSDVRHYGDDDVGKAMAICDQHQRFTAGMTTLTMGPFDYEGGWEVCHTVHEAWLKSEAASRQRQREEQEQRDLDFVNGVAERQK